MTNSPNSPIFSIADLAKKPQGSSVEYSFDMPIQISDPDIVPKNNLKGHITIMKIDKEFNVQLRDVGIGLELTCSKCLEPFTQPVSIPFAEKQYVMEPKQREDRAEIEAVDTKNYTINIEEFLRQEIILHFPLIPVCSTHCQGINQENNG